MIVKRCLCWLLLCTSPLFLSANESRYLDAARKSAQWLRSVAVDHPTGTAWPPDPQKPEELVDHLYSGNAGVVWFFVEMARTTGDSSYLKDAVSGGDYLLATLPNALEHPFQAGLYTGVSGIGFVLDELYKASGEKRFRQGAARCLDLVLEKLAQDPGQVTDIVSGQAGIGLYLIDAAEKLGRPDALKTAERLGKLLIDESLRNDHGWSWPMTPEFPRIMPNFSHGTAGVAFFLARLNGAVKNKAYLNAALQGAAMLQSLAREDGLIYHNRPEGEDLYYLGWCHGPTGTTRLYEQLWHETGDDKWKEKAINAMATVRDMEIQTKRTPGFWNNVGICCGSAGVCTRAMATYELSKDNSFEAFAKKLADDILARATEEGNALKWTHAEHRVKPELLIAQTGYMQGAAGIGLAMLEIHRRSHGIEPGPKLPDQVKKTSDDEKL